MAKRKVSARLDNKLKQLYPEGKALDNDRLHDAEKVYDPSSPAQIEEWAKNKTKSDLKGFDTKDAKEPSIKAVLKDVSSGTSGEDVIQDEPERFLDEKTVAGSLVMKNSKDIKDFESFVKAVEDAWRSDKGLKNIVENITSKDAYEQMFKTQIVQDIIDVNTRPTMVNFVMRKFGVEPVRASRIVQLLPTRTRGKLYKRAIRSNLPKIRMPRSTTRKAVRKARWSEQELNIIRRNKNLSSENLYKLFSKTTSTKRSMKSVIAKQKKVQKADGW